MHRVKAVLTLSAAVAFVLSPIYAGSFRGFDPQQFPVPQVDPPIVPAGYAFSIWGLIYLLLLFHAVFGLVKRDEDSDWDRTRWPLIISLGIGASWISVAQISPLWATILIWTMLVSSLVALFRIDTRKDRLLLKAPIAIYSGWLTAASFVSLAILGAGHGVMTDQLGWAWLILILATGFASILQLRLHDTPEYGLTVAWALVAVAVRNRETEASLAVFSVLAATLIAALAIRSSVNRST